MARVQAENASTITIRGACEGARIYCFACLLISCPVTLVNSINLKISASRPMIESSVPAKDDLATSQSGRVSKNIWIDFDNSPHVPFFLPIIDELEKAGMHVILTARDSYQVCDLLKFHGLSCRVVGGHWGKNRLLKMVGTLARAMRLVPIILKDKPDLAVSHGSRAQFLASVLFGIPTITMYDYEFTAKVGSLNPDWVFSPDLIPESTRTRADRNALRYPGLKEDVYIPRLRPDPSVKEQIGLNEGDLVVTVRPPATEAHYHNPEAEILLDAALEMLIEHPEVRIILLPRNDRQSKALHKQWAEAILNGKIIVPEQVMDGINLIWFSDLVISGGGTMNREAAAMGIPVYSIFRGRIGAVDQYLASSGRLVLIESVADVREKIRVERRSSKQQHLQETSPTLDCIVNGILSIAKHQCLPEHSPAQTPTK
jgi:uncharacterized protein